MRQARRITVFLLIAGLFLGGIVVGWKLTPKSAAPRGFDTPALLLQVRTLSELVTIKYVIQKVEVLEVPSENLVGQMVGSRNRILLLAHGVVKAGINLERVQPDDLRISGKTLHIRLPRAEITDAYLDEKETRVIDRSTGLLAPPAKDLEQVTRQNALDSIRRTARRSGILEEAEKRARIQLRALFIQLGFESVTFEGEPGFIFQGEPATSQQAIPWSLWLLEPASITQQPGKPMPQARPERKRHRVSNRNSPRQLAFPTNGCTTTRFRQQSPPQPGVAAAQLSKHPTPISPTSFSKQTTAIRR
jgi:hypothetical protein